MKRNIDPEEVNSEPIEPIEFDESELTDETLDQTPESAEDLLARKSVYGEIRDNLIIHGIPANEIAFIHDYTTPAMKSKLFADVNAGKIRVLVGSTGKMGTGANFQERLIGLHHVTPCYRPDEIEQREGRILRQGNSFNKVHILVYVTEPSFDAFMWGLVETKARFISQIMAGEVTARTAEEVDEVVLNYAQIKAIASGNPRILEKVATEVELTKLERLYSAWAGSRQRLSRQMELLPSDLNSAQATVARYQNAIATRDANKQEQFKIELKKSSSSKERESVTFTDRGQAGAQLRKLSVAVGFEGRSNGLVQKVIGHYRGFEILARGSQYSGTDLFLENSEDGSLYSFTLGQSDPGVTQSMDAQLRGLEEKLEWALTKLSELEHRREQISIELSKGWEQAPKYEELRGRLNRLNLELTEAGVEIEVAPELSELDAAAFLPVGTGVSIHQLSGQRNSAEETSKEMQIHLDGQVQTPLELPAQGEPACTTIADPRPTQNECEHPKSPTRNEAANESRNGVKPQSEGHQGQRIITRATQEIQNGAAKSEPPQQIGFDWLYELDSLTKAPAKQKTPGRKRKEWTT